MNEFDIFFERLLLGPGACHPRANHMGDLFLRVVESVGESLIFFLFGTRRQTVRRLSKEKLGGRIHRQLEEQILEVDCRSILRDGANESGHVSLERRQVPNRSTIESRSQKLTRVFSSSSVGCKDTVTKQRSKGVQSPRR